MTDPLCLCTRKLYIHVVFKFNDNEPLALEDAAGTLFISSKLLLCCCLCVWLNCADISLAHYVCVHVHRKALCGVEDQCSNHPCSTPARKSAVRLLPIPSHCLLKSNHCAIGCHSGTGGNPVKSSAICEQQIKWQWRLL